MMLVEALIMGVPIGPHGSTVKPKHRACPGGVRGGPVGIAKLLGISEPIGGFKSEGILKKRIMHT